MKLELEKVTTGPSLAKTIDGGGSGDSWNVKCSC